MNDFLISIDPGTTESGVCVLQTQDMKPIAYTKTENSKLFQWVKSAFPFDDSSVEVVIERIQGNNMSVGSEVFITCEWIGRFSEMFERAGKAVSYIFRREEYKYLCANLYSRNDKGVRMALVDRFAYGQSNYGKGTKSAPGWFYGFSADVWQAYAIGVAYVDKKQGERG